MRGGGAIASDHGKGNADLDKPVKTWVGKKHGHTWHYRTDASNRVISFKRVGSKAPEVQFAYDGETGKVAAARIAGHSWFHKSAAFAHRQSSGGCSSDLQSGFMPAVAKAPAYSDMVSKSFGQVTPTIHKFRQVTIEQEDDADQYILDLYNDLRWWTDEIFNSMLYDLFPPGPQRDACINFCNDLTDAVWIVCSLFSFLGPYGPAATVVCVSYFYDRRAQCRLDCMR